MRFTKFDKVLVPLVRCPLCKSRCQWQPGVFDCTSCGSVYRQLTVGDGDATEHVYDFRVCRPDYCVPPGQSHWAKIQRRYEAYHRSNVLSDNLAVYLDQIESVRDLYTQHFPITGHVLDVGGHQGRLRHFLRQDQASLYVSFDPFPGVFKGLGDQPNLRRAYPCLDQACNFAAGHAEALPWVSGAFDWVHMRSVLDHFEDPYVALKEAYRVLKPDGRCLIGLTVKRQSDQADASVPQADRSVVPTTATLVRRIRGVATAVTKPLRSPVHVPAGHQDEHLFEWRYEDLLDVLSRCRFSVLKQHWQRPTVVYLMARKMEVPFL